MVLESNKMIICSMSSSGSWHFISLSTSIRSNIWIVISGFSKLASIRSKIRNQLDRRSYILRRVLESYEMIFYIWKSLINLVASLFHIFLLFPSSSSENALCQSAWFSSNFLFFHFLSFIFTMKRPVECVT